MKGVYILHFEKKIAHAQHYVGCSGDLLRRIEAHAKGHTARLCEVFFEQGIPFRVARLYIVEDIRKAEKYIKKMNNGKSYCPICQVSPRKPRGMEIYPMDFYPLSTEIRSKKQWLSADTTSNEKACSDSTKKDSLFSFQISQPESPRKSDR
jgi:predicted GIY-YIG superfamily endonuclease